MLISTRRANKENSVSPLPHHQLTPEQKKEQRNIPLSNRGDMGANGHPPPPTAAVQNGSHSGGGGGGGGGANPSNGGTAAALRHDPGLAREWSPEEQATLDELLAKYASDAPVIRYAKIAMKLPEKTVRDVALRCRWMNKKESGKRKKEDHNSSKKSKDKKEKVSDSSSKPPVLMAVRPHVSPYPVPVIPMDDDEISLKAIGGPTGEILETNLQVLSQISTNLSNMQIQDNIPLLCQTRDNILRVLKEINDAPEIMKQMPALPVKINEELVNSLLPRPTVPMQ